MKKLLLLLLSLGLILPNSGIAKPIAIFSASNVTITLHDDACSLKSEITNLPKRAVWLQDGKAVEGCFGFSAQFGLVNFYFADKTSTAIPAQFFEAVTGA